MTSSDTILDVSKLTVRARGRTILSGVDLTIKAGEIVTIVGPNGSGKTTLLRAILGGIAPASGRIRRAPGLRIGYVPQKLGIDTALPLTVAGLLSLSGDDAEAAEAALARVGLAGTGAHPLGDLSGGQLQRALLARAIQHRPGLLMLDEPTQGLDQAGSADFYLLIEEIQAETGAAILMVSHDLHVVMSASDRVVCLNVHVCCDGVPDVVRRAPEYRALFGRGTGGALALYRHEHDHHHHLPTDARGAAPQDQGTGHGHGE